MDSHICMLTAHVNFFQIWHELAILPNVTGVGHWSALWLSVHIAQISPWLFCHVSVDPLQAGCSHHHFYWWLLLEQGYGKQSSGWGRGRTSSYSEGKESILSSKIYQTVSLLNSFDTDENFSLSFFFFLWINFQVLSKQDKSSSLLCVFICTSARLTSADIFLYLQHIFHSGHRKMIIQNRW